MLGSFWLKYVYPTLDQAVRHVESTTRPAWMRCAAEDDGFGCTLKVGHEGPHEATDISHKVVHRWDNVKGNLC